MSAVTPAPHTRRAGPLRAERLVEPLLQVEDVDFSYGALQILFDVNLEVAGGATVALLGTNGAGKSTLLRVVGGLLRPSRGTVRFKGEDVSALSAEDRVGLGMSLVEGGRSTFPSLTVLDNLRLGGYRFLNQRRQVDERVGEVLEVFPALRPRLGQTAGTLSGGEQQMMGIGRAMVASPDLLLIDELSLGLAPVVLQELVEALERLLSTGRTLLLVEQSLNVALALTEHAYFMEKGEVRFSGPPSDLVDRGDLVRSVFFGTQELEA